jgi:glycosyltransferase involved in cell wall biosynthesis
MKILQVVPYNDLIPADNGGKQRCYNIAMQMSLFADVDVVMQQDSSQVTKKDLEGFGSVNFFSAGTGEQKRINKKGIIRKILNAIVYRFKTGNFRDSADPMFLLVQPVVGKLLKTKKYDFVVFEHSHAMSIAKYYKKYRASSFFILDAHNVDHLLVNEEHQVFPKHDFERMVADIKERESNAKEYVSAVWTCSDYDAEIFKKINDAGLNVTVIPNGVDTKAKPMLPAKIKGPVSTLFFCGGLNTIANKSGIAWFLDNIWPILISKRPGAFRVIVVGTGEDQADLVSYHKLENVAFLGKVKDIEPIYEDADITIAPLTVGSGTRFKILESLSFGVPVVATSKAAEGVDYENGRHLFIADDVEIFASRIIELTADDQLKEKMKQEGRIFVEKNFDWLVIGKKMEQMMLSTGQIK